MVHLLTILTYASPILGFLGTLLIFYFGVPKQIDTAGKITIVIEQEDEQEKKKIKLYKRLGNTGLTLIALSFVLHLITLLLKDVT